MVYVHTGFEYECADYTKYCDNWAYACGPNDEVCCATTNDGFVDVGETLLHISSGSGNSTLPDGCEGSGTANMSFAVYIVILLGTVIPTLILSYFCLRGCNRDDDTPTTKWLMVCGDFLTCYDYDESRSNNQNAPPACTDNTPSLSALANALALLLADGTQEILLTQIGAEDPRFELALSQAKSKLRQYKCGCTTSKNTVSSPPAEKVVRAWGVLWAFADSASEDRANEREQQLSTQRTLPTPWRGNVTRSGPLGRNLIADSSV